jgi:hypothetical protein
MWGHIGASLPKGLGLDGPNDQVDGVWRGLKLGKGGEAMGAVTLKDFLHWINHGDVGGLKPNAHQPTDQGGGHVPAPNEVNIKV